MDEEVANLKSRVCFTGTTRKWASLTTTWARSVENQHSCVPVPFASQLYITVFSVKLLFFCGCMWNTWPKKIKIKFSIFNNACARLSACNSGCVSHRCLEATFIWTNVLSDEHDSRIQRGERVQMSLVSLSRVVVMNSSQIFCTINENMTVGGNLEMHSLFNSLSYNIFGNANF